jgi:3-isopropylmalate dehydrogenase
MSPYFKIAALEGDGVGPEVVAEGIKVLRAVEAITTGVQFGLVEHSVGATEHLRHGDPLPGATLESLREADAIILGAMGPPEVRWPNGVEMTSQIDLREKLDLYTGVRPVGNGWLGWLGNWIAAAK